MKTLISVTIAGLLSAGVASAQDSLEMTSAFGKNLPILGTAATDFVDKINGISSEVQFEHFDPNKLEAGEFMGWILYDDGAKYWQQMYDDNGYDVQTMPCGVIAPETSGWFKNEINSVDDLKGLNMRFFGLGAKVMEKLGVSTSLLAGGDIFPALERGAIDATEFSMPRIDARLGFHKIAKYNYFPGWHQPSTLFELLINKDVWEDLSETAQNQIEVACLANVMTNLAEGEATNFEAMVENTENNGVIIKKWSPEILSTFESTWEEVVAELADGDEFFQEVWADLQEYRKGYSTWSTSIYLPRQ